MHHGGYPMHHGGYVPGRLCTRKDMYQGGYVPGRGMYQEGYVPGYTSLYTPYYTTWVYHTLHLRHGRTAALTGGAGKGSPGLKERESPGYTSLFLINSSIVSALVCLPRLDPSGVPGRRGRRSDRRRS